MENLFIAFMAIVQGIAEFLPISSSGHLALLGSLFGFDPETNLSLEIVLHAGTLAAIVVFYFRELLTFFRRDRWPLALKIVVGSIPAGIVGIALKKLGLDEMVASNLWIIAAGFLTTATVLLFSERQTRKLPPDSGTDLPQMSFREALLIGCAQAVAILPGISRSGSTIASGLFLKLRPAAAAEFGRTLSALTAAQASGIKSGVSALKKRADMLGKTLDELTLRSDALHKARNAGYKKILTALNELRETVDYLETIMPDESWPLPKYREMLFIY